MRKLTLIPLLSLIFILSVASTCSSDDSPNSSADAALVINTVTSGTWKVTFFEDDGVDETYHFTGYNFTFGASNVLTATNGTNTYTGTWSVTNDDSNDDSPSSSGLDFNIFFTSPPNFNDELSDDWDILSRTDIKIELVDVSGGNGGTDYLTLEKN